MNDGCTRFLFAIFLGAALLPAHAVAQEPRPIYDGVTAATAIDAKKINKTDEAVFKNQVLPSARRAWRSQQKECTGGWDGDAAIRAVALGSFTTPNATQKALLYNYCTPAHAYAFNGVAIIENVRVVAHLAYQSDWQNDIETAPDINKNGRSEILLVSGTTNQGTTWATVTLIELSDKAVRKFGFTEVLSDRCGYDESGAEAWKLFAKPGPTLDFLRESYETGCKQNRWRKTKNLEAIKLEEDTVEYRWIK